MRISKKAEYALRALVQMARRPKSWSIAELSEQERIPIKFLEQILLGLRRAGILGSKRGVGGGYLLLRPPGEISVGEVIRSLDGPLAPVPCAAERPAERCSCPDPRNCSVRLLMIRFRSEMGTWLERHTLEDMLHLSGRTETLAFDI